MNILKSRYSILFAFYLVFIVCSFLIRTILLVWSGGKAELGISSVFKIYSIGFLYDIVVASCFMVLYALYLLIMPQRINRSLFNKITSFTFLSISLLIILFSFFAEITFWQEFESRFNFIAVDYLVYTYEVIHNINESYPMPLLVSGIILILLAIVWVLHKKNVFKTSFASQTSFRHRLLYTTVVMILAFGGLFLLDNTWAEKGSNRYRDELSKTGIFSFFAAFKNNELSYDHFYKMLDTDAAFKTMRQELAEPGVAFSGNVLRSVNRTVKDSGIAQKPNVIMVTIESLSAEFLGIFGNTNGLTPVLDSLAASGISFRNMYATGTRTVRGMEALSLGIPPTPGSSIVRRPNNNDLNTVGHIFDHAGYERTFLYGGDGYFDNMNEYFGNNGYNIVDRGHNLLVKDQFAAIRSTIPGSKVHFENAWGICDEDLYDAVISNADSLHALNKLFYDFVMTTSNHRPFTFPDGKISLQQGQRDAAIRYTDYAIGSFLKKSSTKPWFNNTIFIFVADHCASSAGKNEIDISKYHIPCIIYQPAVRQALAIEKKCSQIDLYPTLFGLLNWSYESSLYGADVLSPKYKSRILLGTYQKLAYITGDSLVILSPQQKMETYLYNWQSNTQTPAELSDHVKAAAIAEYETAYYLFKNDGFKQKH